MEKKNIYETITAVMEEIGAIGKNSKNNQQNFMYRGIDAVMNALSPAFVKHRLFIVPEVLEQKREERQTNKGGNLIYSICRVKYTFYAEDGSSLTAVTIGEGRNIKKRGLELNIKGLPVPDTLLYYFPGDCISFGCRKPIKVSHLLTDDFCSFLCGYLGGRAFPFLRRSYGIFPV